MDVAFHPEKIDPTAFVAPGAFIIGEVTIGPESSVWFGVILRGDIAVLQLVVIYFTP
jgi:carbonic anhydrase/acetyltransferase-like protein (isoleucine patch superfamily)